MSNENTVRSYLINRIAEVWLYTTPAAEYLNIAEQFCQGPIDESVTEELLEQYVFRFYREKYEAWSTSELLSFFNELAAQGEVSEEEVENLGKYHRPLSIHHFYTSSKVKVGGGNAR